MHEKTIPVGDILKEYYATTAPDSGELWGRDRVIRSQRIITQSESALTVCTICDSDERNGCPFPNLWGKHK